MTELGDLLELLCGAARRPKTADLVVADWVRPQATVTLTASGRPGGFAWDAGGAHEPAETRRHIWARNHEQRRVEVTARDGDVLRVGVLDRAEWWRWDRANGIRRGEVWSKQGIRRVPQIVDPPMLSPERLVAWIRLTITGTSERAGREVVRALGEPRHRAPDRVGVSYELEFDAANGIMLRCASLRSGACFQLNEVRRAAFGEEIGSDRFGFTPPA